MDWKEACAINSHLYWSPWSLRSLQKRYEVPPCYRALGSQSPMSEFDFQSFGTKTTLGTYGTCSRGLLTCWDSSSLPSVCPILRLSILSIFNGLTCRRGLFELRPVGDAHDLGALRGRLPKLEPVLPKGPTLGGRAGELWCHMVPLGANRIHFLWSVPAGFPCLLSLVFQCV